MVCLPEPKINASDQIILSAETHAQPFTIWCNLTTTDNVPQESFWMKNGVEIDTTRTKNKDTSHR
jgi:hypothetical protein